MIEARLFSSADIAVPIMLHIRRLWHFIPADASVNVKDRARALHIPVCANSLNDASDLDPHAV
jgi:hypothetical protein